MTILGGLSAFLSGFNTFHGFFGSQMQRFSPFEYMEGCCLG